MGQSACVAGKEEFRALSFFRADFPALFYCA